MKPHQNVYKKEIKGEFFWEYNGKLYPHRLTQKNAMQNIEPIALQYCKGAGLDIGAGKFIFNKAKAIQNDKKENAYLLPSVPNNELDYIFSSHCLEHLERPWEAIDLWIKKIRTRGILFLYLPHIDMELWRPGAPWVGDQHKWSPTFKKVKEQLERRGMKIIAGDGEKDNLYSWHIVARKIVDYPKSEQVNENYVKAFFKNKKVLIMGSAPNVSKLDAAFMESFDIICRVNNYSVFNSCNRTDVYASFFGKSIKVHAGKLKDQGCKLLMCKCPQGENTVKNPDGTVNDKLSGSYDWIYEFRQDWFNTTGISYYIQTKENFNKNNIPLGQICTTGVAAILDVFRCNPKYLYFAGFDFAMSGIHNKNKKMIFKPDPNCHHFEEEFYLMKKLYDENENIDCQKEIKELFKNKYKSHSSWTQ